MSGGESSWYNQGFDGIDKEQQRLDELSGPGRIWIPQGASKDVVWVDDDPCCIYEHNPKMNGNYRNWLTCQQGSSDDVVCCTQLGPNSRYYCGYNTAVDCSEWQDKKGNKHQYEMRLVQMKLRSLKKFKRKKETKGALVGTMWRLTREDDNAPVCGDDWEFQRDIDMDKMFDHVNYRGKRLADLWEEAEKDAEVMAKVQRIFQIEPAENGKLPRIVPAFNYFEILKPKSPKDMRMFLGGVQADDQDTPKGSGGGGSGAAKQDDVPF
jgi:hypothetical protein